MDSFVLLILLLSVVDAQPPPPPQQNVANPSATGQPNTNTNTNANGQPRMQMPPSGQIPQNSQNLGNNGEDIVIITPQRATGQGNQNNQNLGRGPVQPESYVPQMQKPIQVQQSPQPNVDPQNLGYHQQNQPNPTNQQQMSPQQKAQLQQLQRQQRMRQHQQHQQAVKRQRQIQMEEQRLNQQTAKREKQKQQAQAVRKYQEEVRQREQKSRQQRSSLEADGKMTQTQLRQQQQKQKFKSVSDSIQNSKYNQYLFQLMGIQQFVLNPTVDETISILMYAYVIENNAYMRIKNIQSQSPVRIYIYQNNNRIVQQGEFFFQKAINFQAQGRSTYLIRLFTTNSHKLISMNTKVLTERSKVTGVVDKDQAVAHATQIIYLQNELRTILDAFQRFWMLDFNDMKILSKQTYMFYTYQIIQTLLAVGICLWQMKTMKSQLQIQSMI